MLQVRPDEHYFVATVVAHAVAALSAYLSLHACRAADAPPAGRHLPPRRLVASLAAITLTLLGLSALGIEHRLAVWTALLITFGLFKGTAREAVALVITVTFVALVGSNW